MLSRAFLYPNDRNAELVIAARAAGSQPVREQMLSHFLPAAQNPFEHVSIAL